MNYLKKKNNQKGEKEIRIRIFLCTIILIIISIIILIKNGTNEIELFFNSLIIGLGINIISSLVLIILLDLRKEEEKKKEMNDKQKIIIEELTIVIRKFNNFIAKMYKATMKAPVENNEKILENIYYNIDKLLVQISMTDLKKESYLFKEYDEINHKIKNYTWKDAFDMELFEYVNKINEIKINYFEFIESQLLNQIEKIIIYFENMQYLSKINIDLCLNNFMEILVVKDDKKIQNDCNVKLLIKPYYEIVKLRDKLIATREIMNYINEYTNENKFTINIDEFNNNSIGPKIGSGLINDINLQTNC